MSSVQGDQVDQLPPPDVLEVGCPSCSRLAALTEETIVRSGCSPPIIGFTSISSNLPLLLGPYDKPRRLLHNHDFTYVVTAHGAINQVVTTNMLKLDRNIRSSSRPFEEFVDDACILSHLGDPIVVLGHAWEQNQITFLSLAHGQISQRLTLQHDQFMAKKAGVSAMSALMCPLRFVSGGYDHRVHLWNIAQDPSGASESQLISVGADCDIPIYDMSAERVMRTLKVSCIPYHAHKLESQFCILLEVSHLETQFEIRDHRVPTQAVQRFGFLAEEKRGRFEKADSWSHFVACEDENGAVHLWDFRNISTEVDLRPCFSHPVIQVVNAGPHLLACSKRNELACIIFQGK